MSTHAATRATARGRRAAGSPRPAIQVRRPPLLEPPFDDEQPPHTWAGPGAEQLALDLPPAAGAVRWPARGPASAASPALATGLPVPPVLPVPPGASAECWAAARRFVRICLEIFNGYRPAGHVRPLTIPGQTTTVVEQVGLARERVLALHRRASASSPTRAGRLRPAGRVVRPADVVVLRHLVVCEPRAGVAEAAAVLSTAGRAWALAVRLESRRGRWLCTAARTV